MHVTALFGQLLIKDEPNDMEISIHPVECGWPPAFEQERAWIVI
jgi:hypothetical protein